MLDNAKNFAKVQVSTGYDADDTSIVLETGHGAKLPTAPFNVVWWNATDYPDPSDDPNVEIVRVTAKSTDTLTITRAQEGTSASTKNTAGKTYLMVAGPTAKLITDIEAALAAAGGTSSKVRAYVTTSQTVNSIPARLAFDTENFDGANEFDITTNKGRFTANAAGYYLVHAAVKIGFNIADGEVLTLEIRKNGLTTSGNRTTRRFLAGRLGDFSTEISDIFSLSASDYLEVWIYTDSTSGTLTTGSSETYVTIHRLS